MKIEDLRKCCGFYYRETYSDGAPSDFCCMSYVSRSVFQTKRCDTATKTGNCISSWESLEGCPIYKIIQKLKEESKL